MSEQPPRIHMVVDDQEVNRKLLTLFIEREDALDTFKETMDAGHMVDTIIMDLQMPKKSGDDALKLICDYCDTYLGKSLVELGITFHIFTANENFTCSKLCEKSEDCYCMEEVFYKPITKEKIRKLLGK
jgi:CheY-like chemotaxis protein